MPGQALGIQFLFASFLFTAESAETAEEQWDIGFGAGVLRLGHACLGDLRL